MNDKFNGGFEFTDNIPESGSDYFTENLTDEEKEWMSRFFEDPEEPSATDRGGILPFETELISPHVSKEAVEADDPACDIFRCADHWFYTDDPQNSSLAAQMFLINEFTDKTLTASELEEMSAFEKTDNRFGVVFEDLGGLLECFGIDSELHLDYDLKSLEKIGDTQRALVPINSAGMSGLPTLLSGGDRIVEVVSVKDGTVLFNDPADQNGAMRSLSYDLFDRAWSMAGHACVIAFKPE